MDDENTLTNTFLTVMIIEKSFGVIQDTYLRGKWEDLI